MPVPSGSYGSLNHGFGLSCCITFLNKPHRASGGITVGVALCVAMIRRHSDILSIFSSRLFIPTNSFSTVSCAMSLGSRYTNGSWWLPLMSVNLSVGKSSPPGGRIFVHRGVLPYLL